MPPASKKSGYVCQACGTFAMKWAGQCPGCQAWNTLEEEKPTTLRTSSLEISPVFTLDNLLAEHAREPYQRLSSHIPEFDRVCGGGMVSGSVILIGGDPGIGKSTLLLQVAARMAACGKNTLYISGEEAIHQMAMRAQRLGLSQNPLSLFNTNNADECMGLLEKMPDLNFAVIDSIQTLASSFSEAPIGSVNQMRFVTQELVRIAKSRQIILIIVGHVTKEGQLAGPKLIEHMVDAVFYFEGEHKGQFRILRAIKNRFGATNEIGVFEMCETGLVGIENPSQFFLANHTSGCVGSSIFAGIEGTRPILVEVQTLLAKSNLALSRRTVVGIDASKLAMIIAVLETACNIRLSAFDIYLNIAGGLKVIEPAIDLAIAAAVLSSYNKRALPAQTIFFGEIGLSGALRTVSATNIRLKEAEKLGFQNAIIPHGTERESISSTLKIENIHSLSHLKKVIA